MQVAFPAAFYDGQSSERHEVHVRFQEDTLLIEGADVGRLRFPLAMIKISPRVGNTPRFIQLTGGASLEVMENDAVDRLAPSLPGGRFHLAQYKLESKLRWILAMLALTLVFGWSTIQYGVPLSREESGRSLCLAMLTRRLEKARSHRLMSLSSNRRHSTPKSVHVWQRGSSGWWR